MKRLYSAMCIAAVSALAFNAPAYAVLADPFGSVATAKGPFAISQLIIDNPSQGAEIVRAALILNRIRESILLGATAAADQPVVQQAYDDGLALLESQLGAATVAFLLSPAPVPTIH